jgi:hypothetical protein
LLANGVSKGYSWIATEFVEGHALDARIGVLEERAAREAEAIDIGRQVAAGLAHAHERGVIHRDLKPANLLRNEAGDIKICDFGLARANGVAFAISRTGEPIGTPIYMAPEQLRGERQVGPAADIYALGLILLELSTGKRLKPAGSGLRGVSEMARGGRVPRRIFRGMSPSLRQVLSRCLEPHAEDRYPNADTLRLDLEALAAGQAPPLGHLRYSYRMRRRLWRSRRSLIAASLILSFAIWAWRRRAVPVDFETLNAGLEFEINGVASGQSPWIGDLRPGRHEYSLRHNLDGREIVYRGTFDVQAGLATSILRAHAPFFPDRVAKHSWPKSEAAPGEHAWLQLACKTKDAEFELCSDSLSVTDSLPVTELLEGTASILLPFGDYQLRVDAPGKKTIERLVQIEDSRLIPIHLELEDEDSPWEAVVIYSPFDSVLKDVEVRNAKVKVNRGTQDSFTTLDNIRAMWSSIDQGRHSEVRFCVDLPFEVGEFEWRLISNPEYQDSDAWVRIDAGPSFEEQDLVLVDFKVGKLCDEQAIKDACVEIDHEQMNAELTARLAGHRKLFLRYRFGGGQKGDGIPGGALRANSLPQLNGAEQFCWDPALVFAVSPQRVESSGVSGTVSTGPAADSLDAADLVRLDGSPALVSPNSWARLVEPAPGGELGDAYFVVHRQAQQGEPGLLVNFPLREDAEEWRFFSAMDIGQARDSICVLDDVDEDGIRELGIGQVNNSGDHRGQVSIVNVADGFDKLPTIEGELRGDTLGRILQSPGDLDGDGLRDLLVWSEQYHNGGWGFLRGYSGRSLANLNFFDTSRPLKVLGRNQADHFGRGGCIVRGPLETVNGRERSRLFAAIGAPDDDPRGLDSGSVTLFDLWSGDEELLYEGRRWREVAGRHVAAADLDGDGWDEIFVGSDSHVIRFGGLSREIEHRYQMSSDWRQWGLHSEFEAEVDYNEDGVPDLAIEGRWSGAKKGLGSKDWMTTIFSGSDNRAHLTLMMPLLGHQELDFQGWKGVLVGAHVEGDQVVLLRLPRPLNF